MRRSEERTRAWNLMLTCRKDQLHRVYLRPEVFYGVERVDFLDLLVP
jgi:hypothetical protein